MGLSRLIKQGAQPGNPVFVGIRFYSSSIMATASVEFTKHW